MPDLFLENQRREQGDLIIAGIDEAGRGPLAGPVAAAAVILPSSFTHNILNDSKKLTEKKREIIYEQLTQQDDIQWACAFAEVEEIDKLNILRATHTAMARAVAQLNTPVDFCLIDGLDVAQFPYPSKGIIKGDGLSLSIAAASVIAKVSRDRKMIEYAKEFPKYGLEKHKGYGTKEHLIALRKYGPTRIHRKSFQPVTELLFSFD